MAVRRNSTKLSKPQGPTGDFEGDIKVSDKPPSRTDLERVADLPILDANRKARKFKSLYQSKNKVLIIFIRHFFCGNCQEYIRTLSSVLTPSSLLTLPTPTDIVIIGCGQPDLIPMYIRETSCPFPIYADPTKALYAQLGMIRTLNLGPKSPKYIQTSVPSAVVRSIIQGLRTGRRMLSGGDFWQVGGEFVIEEGRAVWCHRMRNTRDHAEFEVLKEELGYNGEKPPMRKRWSSGLVRSLSNRRQSWSRVREEKPRPRSVVLDRLGEEPMNGQVDVAA